MMQTCECKREFLTEADPYALIPTHKGLLINCGCYFIKELQEKLNTLTKCTNELFICIESDMVDVLYCKGCQNKSEITGS